MTNKERLKILSKQPKRQSWTGSWWETYLSNDMLVSIDMETGEIKKVDFTKSACPEKTELTDKLIETIDKLLIDRAEKIEKRRMRAKSAHAISLEEETLRLDSWHDSNGTVDVTYEVRNVPESIVDDGTIFVSEGGEFVDEDGDRFKKIPFDEAVVDEYLLARAVSTLKKVIKEFQGARKAKLYGKEG